MYYSDLRSDALSRHSDGRRVIAERKTAKTQQWRAEELAAVRVDSPDPGKNVLTHTYTNIHLMRVVQYVRV